MRILNIIIILCGFLNFACSSSMEEEQLRKMHSKPINFNPDEYVCISRLHPKIVDANNEYELMRYIDARQCTSCSLKQLSYTLLDSLPNHVSTTLIVNAERGNIALIKRYLYYLLGNMEIYVDTTSRFMRLNPQIPDNTVFHTFLIDQNDSIILIGDPSNNKKIRDLMYGVIDGNAQEN